MKQGKQFFCLTSVNKESGYESEKIALARQDQVISWVTTIHYRGKDGSWNGLNNHVSKIHLNISFRLKEMLKNCITVSPEQFRFSLNKINVIITRIIGVRKKHGPGVHGPPLWTGSIWTTFIWTRSMDPLSWTGFMDLLSWTGFVDSFFSNNEKWTKTEKVRK